MPVPEPKVLLGLLGHPIGHSRSPQLMQEFARAAGIPVMEYRLWDEPRWPSSRSEWWERAGQPRGWNVTIPYKQSINAWLDAWTDEARAVGAVNTVAVLPDGTWLGHNTDADGFWESLRDFPHFPAVGEALVLGGGGAARAVHHALLTRGWKVVAAVRRLPEPWMSQSVPWEQLPQGDWSRFQLIVNATPLGGPLHPDDFASINWESINCNTQLMDLVYAPTPTRLMQIAMQKGLKVLDGNGMLKHQAKKAWDFWKSSGVIPEI